MSIKLIEGNANIGNAITAINVAGAKLDANIQLCGLSVMAHVEAHGDVTLANALFAAMPRGSRRNALAEWMFAFGKLSANVGDNKKELPLAYDKTKTTQLAEAQLKPWYEFSPEKPVDQVFDTIAAINALIRKASKATEVKNPEVLAQLQALLPVGEV